MKHPFRRTMAGVGNLVCVSALLFIVNSLFADAVSTTRIETYKSNRLLPSTQTAESLENLQFHPSTCSWAGAAKSGESSSALYEAMTSEDWANFDLSMESNPDKAKEGMEWLLSGIPLGR